jgi:chromosome segregation ATPase
MKQSKFFLLILIVFTIGVWGCARQAGNSPGLARLRDLESRNAKLEEDYKTVLAQRDQERSAAAAFSKKCSELTAELEQLRAVAQERDDLQKQIAALTAERNAVQTSLTQFTKDLNQLLGRMQATASANNISPATLIPTATSQVQPVSGEGPVIDLPNKS